MNRSAFARLLCFIWPVLAAGIVYPSVNNTCTAIKSYFDFDHSPIFIAFRQESKSGKSRGPGLWKFNNSLLENEDFVTKLKFYVGYTKGKHRQCTSKKLYWEMIKMEIRDFSICFSKRLAHRKKPTETRSCYSNLKPRLYFWLINSFLSQKSRLNLIRIMSKGVAK